MYDVQSRGPVRTIREFTLVLTRTHVNKSSRFHGAAARFKDFKARRILATSETCLEIIPRTRNLTSKCILNRYSTHACTPLMKSTLAMFREINLH